MRKIRYFFVSQSKTYGEEYPGNFLWAPNDASWHHQNMTNIKQGDAIIQYKKGDIVGVAIALRDWYSSGKPSDKSFNIWANKGFKVDVEQYRFNTPVKLDSIKDKLSINQPKNHAPLNKNGSVNQIYLADANEEMVNIVLKQAQSIDQSPAQFKIVKKIQEKLNIDLPIKNESEPAQRENAMKECDSVQKIFFGAPGTGKSFKVNEAVQNQQVFRTTFHPDYDYAQFVGAYKPKKEGNAITYSFVPQVFAKAYAAAWKQYFAAGNASTANNQVYLVIEEVNRGNCAQIFGDIFQLLDRDEEGFSQYSIDADNDFATWLKEESVLKDVWSDYETKVGDGKLKLPPNLNILATMNTSDQSLFPMDSAFKRRFDWEYVPISFTDEEGNEKEAAKYEIDVPDANGGNYLWKNFVEAVNDKILDLTESEDKQLGEFFIKPDNGNIISKERFLGKVMFYLWSEVCKDEHKNGSFFRAKINDKEDFFTFQDLYKKKDLLKLFMDGLLEDKPTE